MTRRVLVTGARGQLGTDVCAVFTERGWTVAGVDVQELDLVHATEGQLENLIGRLEPRAVVHCAGYTNVDQAESEPQLARAVNAAAAGRLARAAALADVLFVHISTDYVFDGAKRAPYVETDAPHPLQVYGATKLEGEQLVRAAGRSHAVVRSSGLYGATPAVGKGGANFVQTMLRLAREKGEVSVVDDEFVTPTYTRDLALQLERIAAQEATGLFHATQQGACSWYEFAAAIFELAGVAVKLGRTSRESYHTVAKRPAYSVLENARLKELGLDIMPDWKDALQRYLLTA